MPHFTQVENPEHRKEVIDTFLKNREILKQRQLEKRIGKQQQEEFVEEFQKPVVKNLTKQSEEYDKRQDALLGQLQTNQAAITSALHQIPSVVGSFIKPIGGSAPEPLDGRTSSFITDTDISFNQDDIGLINKYRGTNDEIPNTVEIKSSNLKKVKDVLGRIRGVQLRSGSVSDKDGNQKYVIDSIDKVREWIDFMISAKGSSKVKPVQYQKADRATQKSPQSTKKKRRERKKGINPKSPELSSPVPDQATQPLTIKVSRERASAFRPVDYTPPQPTKKKRRNRKKGSNPEYPTPEAYFRGNSDRDSFSEDEESYAYGFPVSDGVFHSRLEGTGIRFYKSPGELVERLGLLCASREAGNTSKKVINELVEILDRLLNDKVIKKSEYKKIYKSYV